MASPIRPSRTHHLRWLAIALSAAVAGFMVFVGTRALVTGDYLRPTSGELAGRLDPRANILEALGSTRWPPA